VREGWTAVLGRIHQRRPPPLHALRQVSTAGSVFDTVLTVYTGASYGTPLLRYAENDDCPDAAGVLYSCLSVVVAANVAYHLQVDGAFCWPAPRPRAFPILRTRRRGGCVVAHLCRARRLGARPHLPPPSHTRTHTLPALGSANCLRWYCMSLPALRHPTLLRWVQDSVAERAP
jgi:hypothetical protein